jgi:hypothetical protein
VAQQLPRRLRKSRITDDSDQVRCEGLDKFFQGGFYVCFT